MFLHTIVRVIVIANVSVRQPIYQVCYLHLQQSNVTVPSHDTGQDYEVDQTCNVLK